MVTLYGYKINPNKKIISDIDIQIIYIPLESRLGYTYKPVIKAGDYVMIGSTLGKSNVVDSPLVSSVSGVVIGFEDKYISNGKKVKCVVIENDFKDKYLNKVGKKNNINNYSKNEFIEILKNSSIVGMGGAGFPTYIKYDTNNKVNYLIVNAAECEPYISADSALIYHNAEELLEGIDAIMDIMNIDKTYIAINENNTMVIDKLLKHINTYPNIKIYPIEDIYPSGYERYLVSTILELNYNKIPLEVGVIVNNVSTIYAIYEAIKYHKPLTERIITITGPGIKNPANYKLKIGTNINEVFLKTDILKDIKKPILIAGGAMMGKAIPSDNLIVTADINNVLVMEDFEEKVYPCIKCGKCSEVCPMNLIPSLIMENKNKAKDLKIDKCINCGLCSYICPSKIEVREIINEIKGGYK